MVEKYTDGIVMEYNASTEFDESLETIINELFEKFDEAMENMQFNEAFEELWKLVRRANKYIDETMPWKLAKDDTKQEELRSVLYHLIETLRVVAVFLRPMLTITSDKILEQINIPVEEATLDSVKVFGGYPFETKVKRGENLFPRLDIEKELQEMELLFVDKKEESTSTPHKDEITIEDFDKIELRVAKVLECEQHPKADKLLVFKLKVGSEERQIVSGIAKFYKPEDLIGKKLVVVLNLKPVKLRGVVSEGMILSAATEDDTSLVTISAEGIIDGVEVR